MKFSTTTIATIALIAGVLFGYTFTGFSSIKAQLIASANNTGSANKTGGNMTTSGTSGGAKLHIEEAIKPWKVEINKRPRLI